MSDEAAVQKPTGSEIAAWVIAGAALLLTLKVHLLPALMSGLLVYVLVHSLAPSFLVAKISNSRAKLMVVGLLSLAVVGVLVVLIWGAVHALRSSEGIPSLLRKMAEIVEGTRETLPSWLVNYLPADSGELRKRLVEWLHTHAGEVQVIGREAGRVAAHVLVGMVIGAIVSLREAAQPHTLLPLARALSERAERLSQAFRLVVFAQVRISAINTLFSFLYLGAILPLLGVHLPLVKTMIAVTFIAGLLPVVGNLISNSVIVVVSLSHSPSVALGSLAYLVVIHKLEYFLNARIIGEKIRATTWELLLAMLLMESVFGLAGVIAAPVYYAYLKDELSAQKLV